MREWRILCGITISEVSNVGGARTKMSVFRYLAHCLREKFFCKPMVPMESLCYKEVPFRSHNPPDIKNPKWGNPKQTKNFGFKFFLFNPSSLPLKNSLISACDYSFKSQQNGRESPENALSAWPSRIDALRQYNPLAL